MLVYILQQAFLEQRKITNNVTIACNVMHHHDITCFKITILRLYRVQIGTNNGYILFQ